MIHVIPLEDIRQHRLDTTCECEPRVEFLAEMLVTHMAFDGRHKQEPEVKHPAGWILLAGEDGELVDETPLAT